MLRGVASSTFIVAVAAATAARAQADDSTRASAPATVTAPADVYTGPPTLLKKEPRLGGYAGPAAAFSRIDDRRGALLGLEACLLFDHSLALGLAGYWWSREIRGPLASNGSTQNLGVAYGGAVGRYAFFEDYLVYPSAGFLIGAGTGSLAPNDGSPVPRSNVDTFFVLEPQLGAHMNLTRWARLTLQAGYRFVAGVSRFGYDESTYRAATLGGAVQLGRL